MTARVVPDRSVVAVGSTDVDDGAIVVGNQEMKARLSLTTNSEARAIRGQALQAAAQGALVRAPLVERAAT